MVSTRRETSSVMEQAGQSYLRGSTFSAGRYCKSD